MHYVDFLGTQPDNVVLSVSEYLAGDAMHIAVYHRRPYCLDISIAANRSFISVILSASYIRAFPISSAISTSISS